MSGTKNELRIPKIPVIVRLEQRNAAACEVKVFVAEHQAFSYRRQRVLDLLEDESFFLPVIGEDGNAFIINKATLLWVSLSLSDGELPVEETEGLDGGAQEEFLYDTRRQVEVKLTSGESMPGELLYSLPPDQSRVVDYLNMSGRFIRLWCTDSVYLLNKDHVLDVREVHEETQVEE